MTDAHLAEIDSIGGTLDAVVILSTRETVPHRLDVSGNGGCGPVGIAIVCCNAAKMLELVVFLFHRAFQPVLAIKIHHDAALVKALVALCEVGLYHKAEKLLTRLHLKDRGVVILKVVVCPLPQVSMRRSGDDDGVTLHFISLWLPCPLEAAQINVPTIGKSLFDVVYKFHLRFFLSSVSASCKQAESNDNENTFSNI